MKLIFADEIRLRSAPDGSVWSSGWGAYQQFASYLSVFDSVEVVCRIRSESDCLAKGIRCDGPGVSFRPLPWYVGPSQYLAKARMVKRAVRAAYDGEAAYLLRVPSHVASLLQRILVREGHPYGVVVVADPAGDFAPSSNHHPLRALFRMKYTRDLRRACRDAVTAAYVTEEALQRAYPPSPGALTASYSDVMLTDEWYADRPRKYAHQERAFTALHIGSFVQMYKAQDVLLRALAKCREEGLNLHLTLAGEGRHRLAMEDLAARLGLQSEVTFLGSVPHGESIRRLLEAAGLFLLPSRTEGLPRALLEAMASGLPCIASRVGGVPELLADEDLVPAGDAEALATKICEVVSSSSRLEAMSRRNLATARRFHLSRLSARKEAFLAGLRRITEERLRPANLPASQVHRLSCS